MDFVTLDKSAENKSAGCGAACCGRRNWWSSYRDVLFSTESMATFAGLALLATGWGLAACGIGAARWLYLATAVIAGFPILRGSVVSLYERRISVEVLVALAIAASVGVGEFHAGAVVAVMLLGGGMLEQITIARAQRSVTSLFTQIPDQALVRRGGQEIEILVDLLRIGDRVIVRPGERLAVDGAVVGGQSVVDESPITGESMPLDKAPGDKVFAGSMNQTGMLEVEARKVGQDTTLARVRRLVEEAQASQAPVQRIADKTAKWYVPLALVLAALVWGLTGDYVRGITVLIVFCPCALVLATPTAIVASIGHAARRMILVKGGEFAETVGQIQVVGLDKTGTLTTGKPTVRQVVALDSMPTREVLRLAGSAERFSEHPISIAIRRAADDEGVTLSEPGSFRAITGCGVEAQVDGHLVRVGRRQWLEKEGVSLGVDGDSESQNLESHGHTVLVVARQSAAVGLIAVRDVLRPQAKEAVQRIKDQGIHTVMLTGDNLRAATVIADEVGVDETHAALLPEDKLRLVRQWQAQGRKVAFVGDGINDAPALAAADIGIAMGGAGTDIALDTSDIAFLDDDLTKMSQVVALSRRTINIIRQNIAFSVGLNILSVVTAGLGWISPIGGAVLHEGGAMAVILNAIRLLR
ncbi:MAG: cation-translocating P-type ATPase [Phycisphaeraceae bacterium]|nr:cation-translocating P-type ATPase [Phycisphaeraceae bacterium]